MCYQGMEINFQSLPVPTYHLLPTYAWLAALCQCHVITSSYLTSQGILIFKLRQGQRQKSDWEGVWIIGQKKTYFPQSCGTTTL